MRVFGFSSPKTLFTVTNLNIANVKERFVFFLGAKMAVFRTNVLVYFGSEHIRKPPSHLVRIVFWSGMASNGPDRPMFSQK